MRAVLSPYEQRVLLQAVTTAPSVLNTQPWRIALCGVDVFVHADPARHLTETDPRGREMAISCGAAVFNLRLAAAYLGREPVVRMCPDPRDPTLLAVVDLAGARRATGEELALYAATLRRHTDRYPYRERWLAGEDIARLEAAARREGAVLRVLAPQEVSGLLTLVAEADRRIGADHRVRAETARWISGPHEGRVDGLPAFVLARPALDAGPAAVRDYTIGAGVPGQTARRYERKPNLALLSTYGDRPVDWVRAGQALQRVLLVATARYLSVSFLTQPLERADIRPRVRDASGPCWHAQMVLRLGYGTHSLGPSRRPISGVRIPSW